MADSLELKAAMATGKVVARMGATMEYLTVHWIELPIYVMDFEGHRSYGVVEFGVVCLHEGQIQWTSGRICRAASWIPAADTEVHGLRHSDTLVVPPFGEEYDRFVQWRKSGVFAAHHQQVEHGLLKHTWACPPYVPDWVKAGSSIADWAPWLDTLRIMQSLYPSLVSHQLSRLIQDLGLQLELDDLASCHCPPGRQRYHCALYDALASALLLLHLSRQDGFAKMQIPWLLELSMSLSARQEHRQGQLFE